MCIRDRHKYAETIDEIVVEASNELKIELEIKAIEQTWQTCNLETTMYTKDGDPRGFILRPAEEIKLMLEDNMLNLQTMSSSRFVGQFADKVRSWEKSLNLVSECLEVWYNVQRQWMYLESIFIGSDDIRDQLPEEAKRFDKIDKSWAEIMNETAKNVNILELSLIHI